jgi:hypothetical protein
MATNLYEHMLTVGRRLTQGSSRKLTKGRLIRAIKDEGLTELETVELETAGLQRVAKQVLRLFNPPPTLFQWASIDPPTAQEIDAVLEQLDWEINQYEKAIRNFTKLRDQRVAQRALLLARQQEERT